MNMKLKKSDVNILIMLLGILIPVAIYFFVYTSFTEKTAAMNADNETLQTEVDYLQDLADHKQQYIDDTAAMQIQIDEIKSRFPAEYKPEDDIMYIIGVENDYGAEIPTIAMGTSSMIEVAAAAEETAEAPAEGAEATDDAAGDTVDTTTPAISLYQTPISVSMQSSYRSLKDIVTYINTDTDRKSIDSLSVVFDTETGLLASTMAFNAYSLTGTEKEYAAPQVSGVFYGTSDIFNTGEKSAAIAAEKNAAQEAEAAEAEDAEDNGDSDKASDKQSDKQAD
ncbi:MAG: hypothetical protein PUD03_08800 [Lachnospiraceae bacterium]|nr:hypothetical protein [Lachnospiraceae bacterium]